MLASGKSFQLNISSSVAFRFQAGLTAISSRKSGSEDQLHPRRQEEEEFEELKKRAQPAYYEVVDVYSNQQPPLPARRVNPAAIVSPTQVLQRASMAHKSQPTGYRRVHTSNQMKGEVQQDPANIKIEYVRCYNRFGHKIPAMPEMATIDLFI